LAFESSVSYFFVKKYSLNFIFENYLYHFMLIYINQLTQHLIY